MMDSDVMGRMVGGNMGFVPILGWTVYILIVVILVLGIIALWKQISK